MTQKKQIKNRLKDLKKKTILKKNRIKLKHNSGISDLFNLKESLYYSGFALTNNNDIILFFIDNEFLEKNNLTNQLNQFNLNEDNLQIVYNNKKRLIPKILEDHYDFYEVGQINKNKIDWFIKRYPNCAFYQITEWFGRSVNTLIIVLREEFGKAVGVVKTYN